MENQARIKKCYIHDIEIPLRTNSNEFVPLNDWKCWLRWGWASVCVCEYVS